MALHGRGADERDLLDVAGHVPRTFAFASVRGTVPAEGGFTWFESRGVAKPIAASLRTSVAQLRAWLDAAPEGYGRDRCFLLGFSAGMMMAGGLLLDDPGRFAGAVLLSGALPLDSGLSAPPGRLEGLPIFYGCGTYDDVIPAPLVAQTESYLRERSGADLTARAYRHAHAVSNRELGDIGTWFAERA